MCYWLEIIVFVLNLGLGCLNIRQPPDALNEAMYLRKQGFSQTLQKSHLPAEAAVLMNIAVRQTVGIGVNHMSCRVSSDKTPPVY
jgi:hypothetical protein